MCNSNEKVELSPEDKSNADDVVFPKEFDHADRTSEAYCTYEEVLAVDKKMSEWNQRRVRYLNEKRPIALLELQREIKKQKILEIPTEKPQETRKIEIPIYKRMALHSIIEGNIQYLKEEHLEALRWYDLAIELVFGDYKDMPKIQIFNECEEPERLEFKDEKSEKDKWGHTLQHIKDDKEKWEKRCDEIRAYVPERDIYGETVFQSEASEIKLEWLFSKHYKEIKSELEKVGVTDEEMKNKKKLVNEKDEEIKKIYEESKNECRQEWNQKFDINKDFINKVRKAKNKKNEWEEDKMTQAFTLSRKIWLTLCVHVLNKIKESNNESENQENIENVLLIRRVVFDSMRRYLLENSKEVGLSILERQVLTQIVATRLTVVRDRIESKKLKLENEMTRPAKELAGILDQIIYTKNEKFNRCIDDESFSEYEKEIFQKIAQLRLPDASFQQKVIHQLMAFLFLVRGNIAYIRKRKENNRAKNEETLWAYNEAVDFNPSYLQGLNSRGYALFSMGRNEEAQCAFRKSIALNPLNTRAYNNIAYAQMSIAEYDKANKYFDASIKLASGKMANREKSRMTLGNDYFCSTLNELYDEACFDKGINLFAQGSHLSPIKWYESFLDASKENKHKIKVLKRQKNGEDVNASRLCYIEACCYFIRAWATDSLANSDSACLNNIGKCLHSIGKCLYLDEIEIVMLPNNGKEKVYRGLFLQIKILLKISQKKLGKKRRPLLLKIANSTCEKIRYKKNEMLKSEKTNGIKLSVTDRRKIQRNCFVDAIKIFREAIFIKYTEETAKSYEYPLCPVLYYFNFARATVGLLKQICNQNKKNDKNMKEIKEIFTIYPKEIRDKNVAKSENSEIKQYLFHVFESFHQIWDAKTQIMDNLFGHPEIDDEIEKYNREIVKREVPIFLYKTKKYIIDIFGNCAFSRDLENLFSEIINSDEEYLMLIGNRHKGEEENTFEKLWYLQQYLLKLLRLNREESKNIGIYRGINDFETHLGVPEKDTEKNAMEVENKTFSKHADEFIDVLFSALKEYPNSQKNRGNVQKVNQKKNDDIGREPEPLWLTNLAAMNDVEEGYVLHDYLEIPETGEEDKLVPLQCSFTKLIDNLSQFRLYGKESNKEGTGLCLGFDERFFFREPEEITLLRTIAHEKNSIIKTSWKVSTLLASMIQNEQNESEYLPLYHVLYYDETKKSFIYEPLQKPLILKDGKVLGDDAEIEKAKPSGEAIALIVQEIKEIFDGIKDKMEKKQRKAHADEIKKNKEKQQIAMDLLVYLRNLVKKTAFQEEHEVRILKLAKHGDEQIKPWVSKYRTSIRIPYLKILDVSNPIVKVVGGPKIERFKQKAEFWRHVIARHYKNNEARFMNKLKEEYDEILHNDYGLNEKNESGKENANKKYLLRELEFSDKKGKFGDDFTTRDIPQVEFVQSTAPLA
jgi:hypothetical protein